MQFLFDHFLGTLINFAVVLLTGMLGALMKKGMPSRIKDAVMSATAMCVVYLGVTGMLEAAPAVEAGSLLSAELFKMLIMVLSMVTGTVIGELLDLDRAINRLGEWLEKRLKVTGGQEGFSRGFVACSLLFCVGGMTINGAIQDAQGHPELLFAKAIIDGVSCFIMASSMGVGCAFSSFFLLAYQGLITVGAILLLSVAPASTVTYMSVTGSLIIILVGTNVMGITRVKTANMIPAMFMPIALEALLKLIFC